MLAKIYLAISGIDSLTQIPRWHNVTEINATANGISIAALDGTVTISKPEQKDSGKLLASYGWVGRGTVY